MLNALRHQRNWNVTAQGHHSKTPSVLNALRHQRNWNQQRRSDQASNLQCSTPYGIKGIGTKGHPHGDPDQGQVLNALRHQRNWNPLYQSVLPPTATRAQRLTASKELERIASKDSVSITVPCSTPYGIKGIGTLAQTSTPPSSPTRAQRLTASKELEHLEPGETEEAQY